MATLDKVVRLRVLLLVLAGVLMGTGSVVVLLHEAPQKGSEVALITALPYAEPDPDPAPSPSPEPAAAAEAEAVDEPELTAVAPASESGLAVRLHELLTGPGLPSDARLSVSVRTAGGTPLYSHHDTAPVLPASTLKLVSGAAALARLGPDFRFTTEVHATAPVAPDGTVVGDLVLRGGGDPALATPRFAGVNPERPRTPLESLADQVVAAGVSHVTGAVIGDPTILPHEPTPRGWPERYLTRGDATRSSGLTVEAGRRLFVERGRLQSEPAPDPAAEAAASLLVLLAERGVTVGGGPSAATAPAATTTQLAAVQSPLLLELLRTSVQRSDNHVADTVFRMLGRVDGDGTWASGELATREALEVLGLDWTHVALADGSGLSRDNRLTAAFLTELDARMSASNRAAEWHSLMAVSGSSGTLRRRLLGTVAQGRLHGKTGSLRDVRSLSGAVVGPDGERVHFAVVGSGLTEAEIPLVRTLQDEIVLAIAEDLYDCVRIPVEPPVEPTPAATPPAPAGPEPEVETELVCAA